MVGTAKGAAKALQTIYDKYGKDYFVEIGHKGGTAERKAPGGFGSELVDENGMTGRDRARHYGALGGKHRWAKKKGEKCSGSF